MSINTSLTKWDILSFSCYKYVMMIAVLLIGLVLNSSMAYYVALAYVSFAIFFFLLRTLKLRIEPEVNTKFSHYYLGYSAKICINCYQDNHYEIDVTNTILSGTWHDSAWQKKGLHDDAVCRTTTPSHLVSNLVLCSLIFGTIRLFIGRHTATANGVKNENITFLNL